MKKFANSIIKKVLSKKLLKVYSFWRNENNSTDEAFWNKEVDEKKINIIFKDKVVLNGPFYGLKYNGVISNCSAYFPKLLGSYESELHEEFYKLKRQDFKFIIDIGCAEGYYAVGLARMFPEAMVFAYDSDAGARSNCLELARNNSVLDRMKIESFAILKSLEFLRGIKSLLILDCEGCEASILLDPSSIEIFESTTIVVEVHDFYTINTSEAIAVKYNGTHDLMIIKSSDDIEKCKSYQFKELMGLDLSTKFHILAEGRRFIMDWIVLTPKVNFR
jgi:hypothetical protein